jgi:hypothetical protein
MSNDREKRVAPVIFFGAVVGGTIQEVETAPSLSAEAVHDNFSPVAHSELRARIIRDERTLQSFLHMMRLVEPNPYRTSDNIIL